MKYPFVPKSTAYLKPGQFWVFPLSNGKLAVGVVLQLLYEGEKRNSRRFLAGLLDWSGVEVPSSGALQDCAVLRHGGVHIKAITENCGEIVGEMLWDCTSDRIPLTLSESPGGNCLLQKGFDMLGNASKEDQENYQVFKTWGYGVIKVVAEKRFAKTT